ncbi:MAG: deoxyribonuclease IV [Bacilli bacterium]|nr:deoxyribonuclease IV [Bacilli bacterium]
MESKLYLGSHLPFKAPGYYLDTVLLATEYEETTFMFYTGAPQNTKRADISSLKIEEARKYLHEHDFDESKIVVHAPYIINLAAKGENEAEEFKENFLLGELNRVEALGLSLLVFHPGSSLGLPKEESIRILAENLDRIFDKDSTKVLLCLETMAGKGHEVGSSFEEIEKIIALSKHKERLAVCLDTCHIHDAGYDVGDIDKVLSDFDRLIGLDRLKVIHLNESKNPRSSHKDRHENLGYGQIGFDNLLKWVYDPRLKDIPKILETPYINEKPPYKTEISMIRSKVLLPDWREKLF